MPPWGLDVSGPTPGRSVPFPAAGIGYIRPRAGLGPAPTPARGLPQRGRPSRPCGHDRAACMRPLHQIAASHTTVGLDLIRPSARPRPSAVSGSLASSADWKARHMAQYGYMQHSDPAPPVARSVGQRLEACGYKSGAWGENIVYGYPTPEAVVAGWLASPGHRANIENPGFTAIGVGAAAASGGTMYWGQNFGTLGGSSVPPPAPSPAPAPSPPPAPSPSSPGPPAGPAPTPGPLPGPSPPADAAVEEPAPPEAGSAELRARSFAIRAGRLQAGGVTSLAANDSDRLAVRSRSRRIAGSRPSPRCPTRSACSGWPTGSRAPVPALKRSRCGTSLAGAGSPSIHGASARRCVRSPLRLRASLPST
jgi:Cysteine-rich secretory protein family